MGLMDSNMAIHKLKIRIFELSMRCIHGEVRTTFRNMCDITPRSLDHKKPQTITKAPCSHFYLEVNIQVLHAVGCLFPELIVFYLFCEFIAETLI
jgi:hypothetical protein